MLVSDSLLCASCPPRNKGRWARLWTISYGGLMKMVTGSTLTIYVVFCLDDGMVLMNKKVPPRFMYPKEWQHLTMFILLALNGCIDVMSKNLLPQRCVLLEKGTLVLIFYVLLMLFVSHVQELWVPNTFHLSLIENFLFLMMGSWLVQAGFILYRPVTGYPWQDDDISDIMFITTFFCWHVMINALWLLGIYGISSIWHHCYNPSLKLTGYEEAPYHMDAVGPVYKLLPEVEQSEKGDQALLFSESSLSDRA
ncbi:Transmembrane epididymal protein 1 [Pteropus alecto]|uniref:Transmembrane epididymal protein 1 n=1 Tax=Pteropus alecto TaxID=9402 RepID=L5KXS4_PTEAL|nr:Transmembrane epididymal protein 1 [Pteropus alecto]